MKRFPILGLLLLVPALSLLTLTACSEKKTDEKGAGKDGGGKDKEKDNKGGGAAVKIKAPTDAVIKGKVKLTGDRPKIEDIEALMKFKDPTEQAFCKQGD